MISYIICNKICLLLSIIQNQLVPRMGNTNRYVDIVDDLPDDSILYTPVSHPAASFQVYSIPSEMMSEAYEGTASSLMNVAINSAMHFLPHSEKNSVDGPLFQRSYKIAPNSLFWQLLTYGLVANS